MEHSKLSVFSAPPPLPIERKGADGLPQPLRRTHEPEPLAPLQRRVTGNLGWARPTQYLGSNIQNVNLSMILSPNVAIAVSTNLSEMSPSRGRGQRPGRGPGVEPAAPPDPADRLPRAIHDRRESQLTRPLDDN